MDKPTTLFLSKAAALLEIDSQNPPSVATADTWHDRVGGPRDTARRRIWTPEVCALIAAAIRDARAAREQARAAIRAAREQARAAI